MISDEGMLVGFRVFFIGGKRVGSTCITATYCCLADEVRELMFTLVPMQSCKWGFPKIRGTFFGLSTSQSKDYLGSILEPPPFYRNYHMCTSEGFKVKVSAASGPSGPCVSNPSANSKSLLPLVDIPRCSARENSKRVSFLSGKLGT